MLDSIGPASWIATGRAIRNDRADVAVFKWWTPFFGPSFGTVARVARRPRSGAGAGDASRTRRREEDGEADAGRASRTAWRAEGGETDAGSASRPPREAEGGRDRTRIVFICDNALPHERRIVDLPFTRYAFDAVDGFIVMSESVRADLRALLPPSRHDAIAYVPHPVYQQFGELPCTREEARRRLGVPPDHDVLLAFGYVRPDKGLAVLLDALPAIRAARAPRGVTCLIVGEFYEPRAAYDQQAAQLGLGECVRFVDRYVPDAEVGLYFAAADVVVLPYTAATQSGVVQVAYGFGRPVITTAVGGLPEVVRDGVSGLLVPPSDPAALAGAVARFYVGGSPESWEQGVAAERARYSWDPLAEAIVRFGDRRGTR